MGQGIELLMPTPSVIIHQGRITSQNNATKCRPDVQKPESMGDILIHTTTGLNVKDRVEYRCYEGRNVNY